MQQAYRVIRVVAEAQTIRIVLASSLTTQVLRELRAACAAFNADSSSEVKAVVLDFGASANAGAASNTSEVVAQEDVQQTCDAVRAVAQPVLAVVRDMLTGEASTLAQAADLLLMAHNAVLTLPTTGKDAHGKESKENYEVITGTQAIRNKYTTWSVAAGNIPAEVERILDMLREQSAVALRYAKASVNIGSPQNVTGALTESAARLQALKEVNAFYLTHVTQSADAAEGLQAFLAKRKPQWNNH
jgi:enoyl-CoA hydratase/carnithine racemase